MKRRNESGFVMVLFALMAMAIMLVIGFAVDVGSWYLAASRLQRSSDAAALAGAASLPDTATAEAAAATALQVNGITTTDPNITVTYGGTSDRFSVTLKDAAVPTYMTRLFLSHLSVSRSSIASRPSASPALGSPFNVLGTGDLSIPGLPAKQNFWLAINGFCSPKEDGDYFSAMWDGNKEGLTSTVGADHNFVASPSAHHVCPNSETNANYDPLGYSYFVDVPKPPSLGDSVVLRAYDPTMGIEFVSPDKDLTYPADQYPIMYTQFTVWNANGTVDDDSDDTELAAYNIGRDLDNGVNSTWVDLYTIPGSMLTNGGKFRIQIRVFPEPDVPAGHVASYIGINAFSLGAFRSWNGDACDSRVVPDCPRVYGRGAMSVYNNLSGAAGSQSTFYFAELDPSFVGQSFSVYLWDPGEGVEKIELLGPDGTPLKFDWSTNPSVTGYAGANVDFLDTDGYGPSPGPNRSNNYKFNDRLVTLQVRLPADYAEMVARAGGDKWLRLRYTLGTTPADRTTWGVSLGGDGSGPAHLQRLG